MRVAAAQASGQAFGVRAREAEIGFEGPLDLAQSALLLDAMFADPTMHLRTDLLVRGTRTPDGPAALLLEIVGAGRIRARAWGPGADWALGHAADLSGASDPPPDVDALPSELRGLARRARGLRMVRTHAIVEHLALVVLQQLVQGREAARAWRNLVQRFSEPAPGPLGRGPRPLWLPLGAEQLRALPLAALPPLGVLPRQGELLRRVGERAARIESLQHGPPEACERRLRALPGIGVWTARNVRLRCLGDADAVLEGDHNLASMVAFNLTAGRERHADDARMLELLEPYRGYRGRAVRWITTGGRHPPRRAPRRAMRPLPQA